MAVRCNKKLNYKNIYSQIAKYGKTIPEMAEKYEMEEDEFIKRIQMGLEPKLFSNAMSSSEKNLKHRQKAKNKTTKTAVKQEEKEMSRKNEVMAQVNYRQKQAEKDKISSLKEKRRTLEELKCQKSVSELDILEKKIETIVTKISKQEENINSVKMALSCAEERLKNKKKAFDEACRALKYAGRDCDIAKENMEQHVKSLELLKSKKEKIEQQISELKNKDIFLVAPNYTGDKPQYGTFYSVSEIEEYETLFVVEPDTEYAIEPELKDMLIAGYDSYKEYSNGLRFVMLCAEYACKEGIKYSVLVDDERLKKLIKTHVG